LLTVGDELPLQLKPMVVAVVTDGADGSHGQAVLSGRLAQSNEVVGQFGQGGWHGQHGRKI